MKGCANSFDMGSAFVPLDGTIAILAALGRIDEDAIAGGTQVGVPGLGSNTALEQFQRLSGWSVAPMEDPSP